MRICRYYNNCIEILPSILACALFAAPAFAGGPNPPPPNTPGVCCIGPGSAICFPTNDVLGDCFDNGRPYIIGVTCSPNPCIDPVAGACCRGGGLCIDNYAAIPCENDGGVFQGVGTTCSPNPCVASTQACCFSAGNCEERSPAQCATEGGISLNGVSCTESPCGAGACCTGTNCVVASTYDCMFNGYSPQGAGTTCDPDPCGAATGACCFGDTSCSALTAGECANSGGTFQGEGSDCLTADCGTAACCFSGEGCTLLSAAVCASQGGILLGGPTCADDPCGVGACCTSTNCVQADAFQCLFNGYSYQGAGVACAPGLCFFPCQCIGDMNGDMAKDGLDIPRFVDCVLGISAECVCADADEDNQITPGDIGPFINILMTSTGSCP